MGSLVIVAIPSEDDPVWGVSSEKKPHITLLYLGDSNNPKRDDIAQFMIHAANTSLTRFGLSVDRRGELGDDKADVLFFDDMWELPEVTEFRRLLLQDNTIRSAYDSAEQHPEWSPHLTLGYPKAPAKKVDYPIHYVSFDRIALWDGDYEGVELVLKRDQYPMEVAMSSTNGVSVEEASRKIADLGRIGISAEDFLAHFGVKGMRWGVRREHRNGGVAIREGKTITGKTKVKAEGGQHNHASEDAKTAAVSKQIVRKSGTAALSNNDLRALGERLKLEAQIQKMTDPPTTRFVKKLMGDQGQKHITTVVDAKATQEVNKMLVKKGLKAAAASAAKKAAVAAA